MKSSISHVKVKVIICYLPFEKIIGSTAFPFALKWFQKSACNIPCGHIQLQKMDMGLIALDILYPNAFVPKRLKSQISVIFQILKTKQWDTFARFHLWEEGEKVCQQNNSFCKRHLSLPLLLVCPSFCNHWDMEREI